MSDVLINSDTMTSIADAIRSKKDVTYTYLPSEMPEAIESISGGGITQEIIDAVSDISPMWEDTNTNNLLSAIQQIDGSRRIKFYDEKGNFLYESVTTYGDVSVDPVDDGIIEPPIKEGYRFDGWNPKGVLFNVIKNEKAFVKWAEKIITVAGIFNLTNGDSLYSWQQMIDESFISVNDTGTKVNKGTNLTVMSNTVGKLVIDDKVTYIGGNAFDGCSKLELTELPSELTFLGSYSFRNCSKLALTKLPRKLTTIEQYAFYNCSNLALTELPSRLTNLGASAFYGCSNLALTELPSELTRIPSNAFRSCSKLALTKLPRKLTTIEQYAFYNCSKLALTEMPSGLKSIGVQSFNQCSGLTSIKFTSTNISINSSAFSGCKNLKDIYVPWSEGEVANAPWGATEATIHYNYTS